MNELERERIEAELKAKQSAEARAKEEEEARIQAELKKGDAEKLIDLANDLRALKEKYTFQAKESITKYSQVKHLLDLALAYLS